MAIDVTELQSMQDDLIRARARGVRVVQINGERVEYKTDAEMLSAIQDLGARIRSASTPAATSVTFSSSKGFC